MQDGRVGRCIWKQNLSEGNFRNSAKSRYICKEVDKPAAIEAFKELNLPIQMTCAHNYLGGFIGGAETKETWIDNKIPIWMAVVEIL